MTSSKHPSFGWNLVYFGITLTFLIQTLGSPLLADYYRGTLRKYHDCKNSLKQLLFVKEYFCPHKSRMEMGMQMELFEKLSRLHTIYKAIFFPESASVSPSQLIVDGVINTVMCDINLNFPTLQSSREQVQKIHYAFESYGFNKELMHNLV